MAHQKNFREFDAFAVPLEGSNLIEASAGTGKTYSIAIVVLRLLLEKKYSIKEILMVTFTKAAVAELEERIRLFIRNAYRVSEGEVIKDGTINSLVERSIKDHGHEAIKALLKEATLFLDETAVMTIHSFCQQTLNEFAFETNQLFNAELLQDTSGIMEEETNQFWRKNITTIPTELLIILMEEKLSRNGIMDVVKEHINGKRFQTFDPNKKYSICEEDHLEYLQTIQVIQKKEQELKDRLIDFILNNQDDLKKRIENNSWAKKTTSHLIGDPKGLTDFINSKKETGYIVKVFGDKGGIIDQCNDCEKVKDEIKTEIQKCLDHIYCVAITEISAGISKYKLYNNQLSFDDLIANLNKALTKQENPRLEQALQQKYKAVFIDEFQDTDRQQYEIFNKAFSKNTDLFYIGDPKQSIYAWRKADIFTYFKAREDVDHLYGMNINFRSTEKYIEAMNTFFLPVENFDTFHFAEKGNSIEYIKVKTPDNNSNGILYHDGVECMPVSINEQNKNKEGIALDVVSQVVSLLSGDYVIEKNGIKNLIQPSDIGILVRNKKDAATLKNELGKYNIPSVSIVEKKVLQSPEAMEILYVLQAMENNTLSQINKALLSSFTGFTSSDILLLDAEKVIQLFRKYKTTWEKDGVYAAMIQFITDFNVQQYLLGSHTENSERIITNLYHLVELIHKNESLNNQTPPELADWLKRVIEQKKNEGDEWQQRIENDEEAVKIVTIHSSKGLQYNIVLAPYLDFVPNKSHDVISFRDEATGDYISARKGKTSDEQTKMFAEQEEQENRRLLYVALTRAVYKSFIYRNTFYGKSSLTHFTGMINREDPLIEWVKAPPIPEGYSFRKIQGTELQPQQKPEPFTLLQNNWSRLSYSMLSPDLQKTIKPRPGEDLTDYDQFIFHHLSRGNITGNMLHYIFENLYFKQDRNWETVITKAVKRFAPAQAEKYSTGLKHLVKNVLHAKIDTPGLSFQLLEVDYEKRLHELEFDFPVSLFQPTILSDFTNDEITINVRSYSECEGMMNGKIDMFFEHQGKYFILDWKSTYLGYNVNDYTQKSLAEAMNDNNYHLQYLIYTLAVKKYLQSRVPGFDYESQFGGILYLFVRGMREGKNSGIYHAKPSAAIIERLENILESVIANA